MNPENSNQSSLEAEGVPLPGRAAARPALTDSGRQDKFFRWLVLAFLCVCVMVAAGVRLRLLDFPLERDEGEYAYAGQLIREGIPPYQLAYNMKMPGIYLAYAGLMTLFGETTAGIHLGLLAVNLATLGVLFLIARKLLDLPGAVIATAAYALMTLSPAYLGLAAHATHFVTFMALLGIWMLLRMGKNGRAGQCLLAGCLFGTAFLMKQQGMFLGIFGGLWLGWSSLAGKMAWPRLGLRLGLYGLGCLLPFLAVCLWLKIAGVFPAFWFWTITYAREYVGVVSFHEGLTMAESVLAAIIQSAPLLWILAGLGLACLCLRRGAGETRLFLGGLLVFSGLAVCPGFYFRQHYFIVLVPAVALLAGLAVSWSGQWLTRKSAGPWPARLPFLLAALGCAQSLQTDRAVFFFLSPVDACRMVYNPSPFPESPMIARYFEENTRPDDRIVVIGSEPQIYFLAHRHSSTGHIYSLPLMQPQPFARTMQETMIHEIESNSPAFLVLVSMSTSWEAQPNSSPLLAGWVADYLNQHLKQVGMIQYVDGQPPEIIWGPEAATTPVGSGVYVAVFKREATAGAGDQSQAAAHNKMLMDRFNNCANDATMAHYLSILQFHPNDAQAHSQLGVALNVNGQTDAAIEQFKEALQLDPDNYGAHNNLGVILGKQNQTAAAINQFQTALRLKDDPDVRYNLGNALLKNEQIEEAIVQFRASLQLKPDYVPAHYNLGIALMKHGDTEAAIGAFQEAIRLQPDYAIAHNSLGLALAAQGRLDEAISEFQAALQIKPNFTGAQNNLARAQALKNK